MATVSRSYGGLWPEPEPEPELELPVMELVLGRRGIGDYKTRLSLFNGCEQLRYYENSSLTI
jgi:hypothetical protein